MILLGGGGGSRESFCKHVVNTTCYHIIPCKRKRGTRSGSASLDASLLIHTACASSQHTVNSVPVQGWGWDLSMIMAVHSARAGVSV